MHNIKWALLLSVFWLLLSGFIQPLLLSFGAISVVIVMIVLRRMDAVDKEPKSVSLNFHSFRYFFWLIGQIFLSSTHVTKLIWGKADQVPPALSKISLQSLPDDKKVLYANSITLTPGTLSVDLQDEEITVHALQASSIASLKQGGMESKIPGHRGEIK
jgi:multicomponent Na+:H+ antiporter subunit E